MKNLTTSLFATFFLFLCSTSFAQPDSLFWKPIENSECLFWDRDTLTSISFSWDGDCKNGFIHGEGKLEIKRPDSLEEWYAGSVEKGRFNGFGIYKGITDYYEGYFKNGNQMVLASIIRILIQPNMKENGRMVKHTDI